MENPTISVLMSVYAADQPHYLEMALESISGQTRAPHQIVIVKDGPLSKELDEVISVFVEKSIIDTEVVRLDRNVGLGEALNEGLKFCMSEWVMRMDSDDISCNNRIEIMQNEMNLDGYLHDVYGAYYEEFNQDNGDKYIRKVPLYHDEIVREMGSRNPMNHVSVLINRQSLLDVQGYKSFLWFEDYFLWVRMILSGKKLRNFQIITVNVRVGDDMFQRRRGLKYFKQEYKMLQFLLTMKLINYFWFTFYLMKRGGVRFLPVYCIKILYKLERNSKK